MTAATSLFDDIRVAPRIVRRPVSRPAGQHRLLRWLARSWDAACRRAQDPRRVVPHY
ncbi:MAG: hypothetical protein LH479_14700 [Polaromonas sp.]|nr:hypothetical protein [Polaromonas sp.]